MCPLIKNERSNSSGSGSSSCIAVKALPSPFPCRWQLCMFCLIPHLFVLCICLCLCLPFDFQFFGWPFSCLLYFFVFFLFGAFVCCYFWIFLKSSSNRFDLSAIICCYCCAVYLFVLAISRSIAQNVPFLAWAIFTIYLYRYPGRERVRLVCVCVCALSDWFRFVCASVWQGQLYKFAQLFTCVWLATKVLLMKVSTP